MPDLRLSEIPEYLRDGELYETMLENDNGEDEVMHFDQGVVKKNKGVENLADCECLLNSLNFWGVNTFFDEIAAFVMSHITPETDEVLARYEAQFAYIWALRIVAKKIHRKRIHDAVIQSGCIELVDYFLKLGDKLPEQTGCLLATQIDDVKMLAFVHQHGCVADDSAAKEAVLHGNLDCLDYLFNSGVRLKECLFTDAARGGNIACLHRLYEHFWGKKNGQHVYARTMEVCMAAASQGHVHILQYMKEQAGIATEYSCLTNEAAAAGHLDCLKYLHENNCAWNQATIARAAAYGHLQCLQYMHEQGCPWDETTCVAAAKNGCFDCLEYAQKHGCPQAEDDEYVSLRFLQGNPVPPFKRWRIVWV